MSLWRRLWATLRAGPGRRPRRLHSLRELAAAPRERVEIVGVVEALEPVLCPVSGRPAVALEYTAWPQSSTLGIDGAGAYSSRAFQVKYHQAADFVLCDGPHRALIRVDPGRDLLRVHRELLARHGVGLRSEQHLIAAGARVRVIGRVESASATASPHRREAYLAVVRAERFWLAD